MAHDHGHEPRTTSIAPEHVNAVLLAGGRSVRFGRDKSSLLWKGETLLERGLRVLRQAVPEVRVGLPPQASGQPEAWSDIRQRGIVVEDDPVGIGPLGCFQAALASARTEWTLFMAVDLPWVESDHVRRLLATPCGPDGVVGTDGREIQPAFAVYNVSLLRQVQDAIHRKHYALKGLVDQGRFRTCVLPSEILRNVNRPQDLPADE
ncbi:MAG: molybdenum cofactor guanylyltransferase [Rhodothermales bacterium]|nr:molybdenum cofactor guanylyltransferase [Rhodothermales bacterium]